MGREAKRPAELLSSTLLICIGQLFSVHVGAIGAQVTQFTCAHDTGLDFPIRADDPTAVIAINCDVFSGFFLLDRGMTPIIDQKFVTGNIHVHLNT